ncbi:MAG TPA: phosphatase domain-containing protein [Thermoguttaceae bacterium]|nr:phosphatase domain-containing protein [Thermoguttaceae bacterium]
MADAKSEIKDDEVVVFYPTYARQVDDGRAWSVSVHGSIFEPEEDSLKREALLALLRRLGGLAKEEAETRIFKERARAFLVDNEGGKGIAIRLGDKVYAAGTSGADGHFTATLKLPAAEVDRLRRADPDGPDWLTFQAVTRPGDRRTFAGRVRLIGPGGLSVISDVDDTIKVSMVRDRRALVRNTFLREFKPVEGMAELYRRWADAGAAFHYLSASPWQLYGPLCEFIEDQGFPPGTFHLKRFRLKDRSALGLFGSQEGYKSAAVERILADFPRRRFILVGDAGEQDPEIYGAAARKHPEQVVRVLIRNVDGSGREDARFKAAFDAVPADRWRIFRHPQKLADVLPENAARPSERPQD